MTRILASTLALACSLTAASAAQADPLDPGSRIGVSSSAYFMDRYLSSTPATLVGFDVTFDHDLTPNVGLRGRAGTVALGFDELGGLAPRAEAGAYGRFRLGARLALEAAVLGGVHLGGLDHKGSFEDRSGPTAMAEVALQLALTDRVVATLGGGYRVAWTAQEIVGSPDAGEIDDVVTGPVARLGLGWSL